VKIFEDKSGIYGSHNEYDLDHLMATFVNPFTTFLKINL